MPTLPSKLDGLLLPAAAPAVRPKSVYIVGGSVRDLLLGRTPLDYDLAVAADPESFAHRLASQIKGRLVELGKPGLMIYRVVSPPNVFDISGLNGSTIEADLNRRDFTINAMAVDLANGEIVDVLDGREDLLSGRVQMVSESVFKQDPVRLVRAFRMAAAFNFSVSIKTARVIREQASLITRAAGERIWSEILKILETKRSDHIIEQMVHCGLLGAILPEITEKALRTGGWDLLLRTYAEVERLLIDPSPIIPATFSPGTWSPAVIPVPLLKFATIVQGVEKWLSVTHHLQRPLQKRSADHIYHRLKMSNRQAQYIEAVIRHYQEPLALFSAQEKKRLSDTAVTRFFMSADKWLPDLLISAAATLAARRDTTNDRRERYLAFARELLQRYYFSFKPRTTTPPLLTGRDLIARFKLKPSPAFRVLLNQVETDRLTGRIKSKQEALDRVNQYLQDERLGQ